MVGCAHITVVDPIGWISSMLLSMVTEKFLSLVVLEPLKVSELAPPFIPVQGVAVIAEHRQAYQYLQL